MIRILVAAVMAAGSAGTVLAQEQQQDTACDPGSESSASCDSAEQQMEPSAGQPPATPESDAATDTTGIPDPTANMPPDAGSDSPGGTTGTGGTDGGSSGSSGDSSGGSGY